MKKEVKIGIFAVIILFGLYWGINFLKGKDLFKNNKTYYAYYDNISGVQIASPILIKGIQVGVVRKIKFMPERNNSVQLQLNVKSEYVIPKNSVANITTTGLIGSKAIEIELGDSKEAIDNGGVVNAKSEESLIDIAGSEFDYFKNKISALISNLNTTLCGVNKLLEENGEALNNIVLHVETATASVDKMVAEKADSLAVAIDNINSFSTMLAANRGHVENTMKNLDKFSSTMVESDVKGTIEQLNAAAKGLSEMINEINSGEGSVGLLIKDRGLYDSLKETSDSLNSLLDDVEKNPKRYVRFSLF